MFVFILYFNVYAVVLVVMCGSGAKLMKFGYRDRCVSSGVTFKGNRLLCWGRNRLYFPIIIVNREGSVRPLS